MHPKYLSSEQDQSQRQVLIEKEDILLGELKNTLKKKIYNLCTYNSFYNSKFMIHNSCWHIQGSSTKFHDMLSLTSKSDITSVTYVCTVHFRMTMKSTAFK